jgi:L-fucose mutarotase/ribose pyranase (RbsD/FucU family)
MPNQFTPPMSGALLTLLDELRAGDWLALASANAPMLERKRSLTVDAPLEDVAAAVFDILPISRDTLQPLAGWAVDHRDPRFTDLAFAVQGLASDGSGRRQEICALPDEVLVECAADEITCAVRVPRGGAPFLFLVCVGGAPHQPTDLRRRRALARVC